MAAPSSNPAQLGADNVIRFVDPEHFLSELSGNLGRGRAFVRSRRHFELHSLLDVEIEGPGVPRRVEARAVVVFIKDGFVGLELEDFENGLLPRLDRLGRAVEEGHRAPQGEATVIGPLPEDDRVHRISPTGSAIVHITEEDEAETGSFPVLRSRPVEERDDPNRSGRRRPPAREETQLSPPLFELEPSSGHPTEDIRRLDVPSLDASSESTFDEPMPPRAARRINTDDDSGDLPPPPQTEGSALHLNPLLIVPDLPPEAVDEPQEKLAELEADMEPVTGEGRIPAADTDQQPPPDPGPPPPPAVEVAGAEALEDKGIPLPRMTRGGVLKVTDPGDLLGRYLGEIRHGALTVYGGPEGAPGTKVSIKIAGQRVISLDAEIVARIGPFLTLKVAGEPIIELLREAKEPIASLLEALKLQKPATIPPAAPPPPPPAPVVENQGPTQDLRVKADPNPTPDLPPEPPPPPPIIEDDKPPEAAKLVGDVATFRRKKDLRHELDVNLKNGGLFVESSPLPIRSKKRIKVNIGFTPTGVVIEADVVFADGGRVGFSIGNPGETYKALEEALSLELLARADDATIDLDELQIRTPSGAGEPQVGMFSGNLTDPASTAALLDFQSKRIEHASGLSQSSAFSVFEYVTRMGNRCVINFVSGTTKRSVWIHEGSVAFVQASPYEEASSLGRLLVAAKKLHESQLREALEKSKSTGKSLGRVLVALGSVKKNDLSAAIREQSRIKVQGVFEWKKGTFEVLPWSEPPGDADLVLTKGLTVLGRYLRERFEQLGVPELEALFGKNLGRAIAPTNMLEAATSSLGLQPKEMRFLELQLDGTRSILDACLGSPVGKLASLRLVGVCLCLGLVQFTDGNKRIVRTTSTSATADSAAHARAKRELQDRLTLLSGGNHFDTLGVHWSAHHRNYRLAYDKLKSEFSHRGAYKDVPEELQKLVKAIVEVIETAYTTLSDPVKRSMYRKQMFDQTERQYAAEMLVKQGEVALMRGDRVAAIEMLETAVELDPSQRNRALLTTAREGRR